MSKRVKSEKNKNPLSNSVLRGYKVNKGGYESCVTD
jgi:hypothetical protein